MTLFDQWILETRKLQEEAYKADYSHFDSDEGAQPDLVVNLVDYIGVNVTAAFHELVELQSETSWKPWQMDKPYVHREQVLGETVDTLHFMANILAALNVSDEELNAAYLKKMNVNRERQLGEKGYYVLNVGVKCRVCKRALDDVAASVLDATMCNTCAYEDNGA